jgi:4'-phosphopantetheinyl transferase
VDAPVTRIAVPAEGVAAWAARLDAGAETVAACTATLADEERSRAARFHFEPDRRRFAVARGTLRMLLGAALGRPARDIAIRTTSRGRPFVDGGPDFSLSHAGDHAVFAFARGARVGIDLEALDRPVESMALARRFFAAPEVGTLEGLPEPARHRAFIACWTRKEAVVKATGEGMATPLDSFEVSVDPDTLPRLVRPPSGASPA